MEHIIEVKNLNKHFDEIKAVQDLSFHVKPGELFAFLGVNGAGKSTTISSYHRRRRYRKRHRGYYAQTGRGFSEFRTGPAFKC